MSEHFKIINYWQINKLKNFKFIFLNLNICKYFFILKLKNNNLAQL